MIHGLRIRIAKRLYNWSVWFTPSVESSPLYDSLPDELKAPRDASVEVADEVEQWQPEQHGNVIIAEPELMVLHRRGKV